MRATHDLAPDHTRLLEHPQVLGDGGLRDAEAGRRVTDGSRTESEALDDAAPNRVRQRSERIVNHRVNRSTSVRGSRTSLGRMAYTSAEGRQELLEAFAEAIEQIGFALADLGAAYEQLDERNADRLEAELFGPVQRAYGRAKAGYARFADRHGMAGRSFPAPSPGLPSTGAKGFIDSAVDAVAEADTTLSELQDSSLPTEVGDVELRAGLTEVRELLGGVRQRAREVERTLGR
jgi:hypothetical protein